MFTSAGALMGLHDQHDKKEVGAYVTLLQILAKVLQDVGIDHKMLPNSNYIWTST